MNYSALLLPCLTGVAQPAAVELGIPAAKSDRTTVLRSLLAAGGTSLLRNTRFVTLARSVIVVLPVALPHLLELRGLVCVSLYGRAQSGSGADHLQRLQMLIQHRCHFGFWDATKTAISRDSEVRQEFARHL